VKSKRERGIFGFGVVLFFSGPDRRGGGGGGLLFSQAGFGGEGDGEFREKKPPRGKCGGEKKRKWNLSKCKTPPVLARPSVTHRGPLITRRLPNKKRG